MNHNLQQPSTNQHHRQRKNSATQQPSGQHQRNNSNSSLQVRYRSQQNMVNREMAVNREVSENIESQNLDDQLFSDQEEGFNLENGQQTEEEEEDVQSVIMDQGAQRMHDEEHLFKQKLKFQKRALFRKNATLQKRQVGTNICQIITPILGLLVVHVLKQLGESNLDMVIDRSLYVPIPFIFNIPYKPLTALGQFFNISECDQWYLYDFGEEATAETREFWGENTGKPMHNPYSTGMLNAKGNILEYACKDVNRSVPYFEELDKNRFIDTNDYLTDTISLLHKQEVDYSDRNYPVRHLEKLPDGTITVDEANKAKLKYKLQINDNRYWQYHRNNGITKIGMSNADKKEREDEILYMMRTIEGQISVADMVNQAYIRELFPDTHIITGIQFMPFSPNLDIEIERIINLVGLAVFPSCMCLALPVFIYNLVLEKESKLLETMKINGMKMSYYYLVNFVFNFIVYLFTVAVYWGTAAFIFKMNFFVKTDWRLLGLVFFGWGLSQISLSFFFSVFINSSQTASIIGYTMSIWACTIAVTLNITVWSNPQVMDWGAYTFPIFPYTRIFYHMAYDCAYANCFQNVYTINEEIKNCLIAIYVGAFVYMIMAIYLHQVFPSTYGVPKHPLFFLKKLIKKNKYLYKKIFSAALQEKMTQITEAELREEDDDSRAERQHVHSLNPSDYYKYPLVVKDIRKVYPGVNGRKPKVANKSICLKINRGELFGLLGPNGAGKTTLISQLIGMYRPTQGNAWIAGYDIKGKLDLVQLQIGVCPQFDILWNDLTVEEHLLFYARLKGVQPDQEQEMVNKAMKEVQLLKEKDMLTKQLPLGMKRRLSIAIGLVANPKVVFLDEPTTGLDPETRRQLWNILQECGHDKKRAIVLTTHSMEEADVLCNRIGIVNDGIMKCIGSQTRLKNLYGGGYHLFVNCQKLKHLRLLQEKKRQAELRRTGNRRESLDENDNVSRHSLDQFQFDEDFSLDKIHEQVMNFISKLLPQAILLRDFNGNFVYQIPIDGFNAERLFLEMEKNKEKLKIADWGISQCSLEDVFTRICGDV